MPKSSFPSCVAPGLAGRSGRAGCRPLVAEASGGPGGACGPAAWGDGRAGLGPDPPGPPDACPPATRGPRPNPLPSAYPTDRGLLHSFTPAIEASRATGRPPKHDGGGRLVPDGAGRLLVQQQAGARGRTSQARATAATG